MAGCLQRRRFLYSVVVLNWKCDGYIQQGRSLGRLGECMATATQRHKEAVALGRAASYYLGVVDWVLRFDGSNENLPMVGFLFPCWSYCHNIHTHSCTTLEMLTPLPGPCNFKSVIVMSDVRRVVSEQFEQALLYHVLARFEFLVYLRWGRLL